MTPLLRKLVPVGELRDTVFRFPFSILCAFIAFIMVWGENHRAWRMLPETTGRILGATFALYLWFTIARIIAESKAFPKAVTLALSLTGVVMIGYISYIAPLHHLITYALYAIPALCLLFMAAPFLRGGDDFSVWSYNCSSLVGFVVSYAALLLFALGVCAALHAVHVLFEVRIPSRIYEDIWAFALLIIGPVYALSWIPRRFAVKADECHRPSGLTFIVNWISAPMALVYLLILYAYFIKITIIGAVPNGHLAYLISGFVGAGIVTYLSSWPLRDTGAIQLRFFHRVFFAALFVPVGFYIYVIYARVDAYGITEQRYLLIISALWFLFLACGYSFKKLPLKYIPLSLAVLLIMACFGPWSAYHVSARSQTARLEAMLSTHDLLEEGAVVKADDPLSLSFEDRKALSSMLEYFCRTGKTNILRDSFGFNTSNITSRRYRLHYGKHYHCRLKDLMKDNLGIEYVSRYQGRRSHRRASRHKQAVVVPFRTPSQLDIRGYDDIYQQIGLHATYATQENMIEKTFRTGDGSLLRLALDAGHVLTVVKDKTSVATLPLAPSLKEKILFQNSNSGEFIIEGETEEIRYKLIFLDIKGAADKDSLTMEYIKFMLLVGAKQ